MAHRDQHHSRDDEQNSRHSHQSQRLPEHHDREERDARNRPRCQDRVRDMEGKEPERRSVEYERHPVEEEPRPKRDVGENGPWVMK